MGKGHEDGGARGPSTRGRGGSRGGRGRGGPKAARGGPSRAQTKRDEEYVRYLASNSVLNPII